MGYTTYFNGYLTLSKQPTPEQVAYINAFASTRRVRRKAEITAKLPDPIREAVGLPVGLDGGYYVGDDESGKFIPGKNPEEHNDIVDINTPPGQKTWKERQAEGDNSYITNITPEMQPGLWCQWVLEKEETEQHWNNAKQAFDTIPNDSPYVLKWDEGEKFYNYVEWLQYLITNFFEVWGIKLNGEITWEGEESGDLGLMEVTDNVLTVKYGEVVYK